MNEYDKFTAGIGTSLNIGKSLGVSIHLVSKRVMEIYNKLQETTHIAKDARLSVLKSSKVRRKALVGILEDFKASCKCEALKDDVQKVIYCVNDMLPHGQTRLFVQHNKKNLKTELEFVCLAVRMYKFENEVVSDFCISTYSYAKSIDKQSLVAGVALMSSGAAFGACAVSTFATGGVGPIVMGTLAAIFGFVFATVGTTVVASSMVTDTEKDILDMLEACFLKELVNRGHAVLQNERLFIKTDELD